MSDRQESAVAVPEAGHPKHDHPVLRRVLKDRLREQPQAGFHLRGA